MSYILGMRLRRQRQVNREVLSRAGRYHRVADNLWVKEVWVEGRRYVVGYNPEEEERDRERQEELLHRARQDLEEKGPRPS